jgi:hypothetical protein
MLKIGSFQSVAERRMLASYLLASICVLMLYLKIGCIMLYYVLV